MQSEILLALPGLLSGPVSSLIIIEGSQPGAAHIFYLLLLPVKKQICFKLNVTMSKG